MDFIKLVFNSCLTGKNIVKYCKTSIADFLKSNKNVYFYYFMVKIL